MRWLALGALIVVVAPAAFACSGASSFPPPATCAAPTPLPPTTGRGLTNQYFNAVRKSVDQLSALREQLRAQYPGDKFSKTQSFRLDFAKYADETACVAQQLRDMKPPSTAFEMFDADMDSALQALIDHTIAGREAVRKRNKSDYGDWYRGVDAKIDAVKAAANGPRR